MLMTATRTAVARAVADDPTVFEGYAALFETEDGGRDIILRGAFRDTLARRGASAVKLLYQHDTTQPIGVWLSITEDAHGLKVRGRLMPEIARAREILAMMRAGALDGLSIGFRAVQGRRDQRSGIRRLAAVDLWEISLVTFPMQPGARVTRVAAPGSADLRATQKSASNLSPQARLAHTIAEAARLFT